MEINFCRRCGTPLTKLQNHVYRCDNGHTIFANASPTIGMWLVNEHDEVLVVTRGNQPGKGLITMPGGFVDGPESFERAIARELQEELNLSPSDYHDAQYITSGPNDYRYGGEDISILNTICWARVSSDIKFTAGDDVASAQFMPIDDIPTEKLYLPITKQSLDQLQALLCHQSKASII